jgi:hypothetical protein
MNISDIRVGLADLLNTIPDVQALAFPPDQIPAGNNTVIVVAPAAEYIDYHEAFAGGLAIVRFTLTPYIQMVDPRSAFNRLDALISSGTGEPKSIIDFLMAKPRTLDGACFDMVVDSVSNVSADISTDAARYLTATIELRVYAGRM